MISIRKSTWDRREAADMLPQLRDPLFLAAESQRIEAHFRRKQKREATPIAIAFRIARMLRRETLLAVAAALDEMGV